MAIELPADSKKLALASLRRFCNENLDLDMAEGDLQALALLDFFLKEVAPTVYNGAVADAQVYLRERVADLDGACYQPEFAFWPKPPTRRK